jgi:aspartate/methionine/tyrosine aminotransferase
MISRRSTTRSPYMEWAKLYSAAKFSLATSGMMSLPLTELGVTIEQLEINGPNNYGYTPLLEAIAQRYRVPQKCVVAAMGTSLANYLALAAATDAGDEILVEQPSYDPLLTAASYLGLKIKRFQRPAGQSFAVDMDDLERNLNSSTRVIALCNLHNPSGALIPDSVLQEIALLARKYGAYVLVDEVYREMLFEAEPQSAFHIDPDRFIITNSLTKAYGLSGLRCGWVLAPPGLTTRMWHINDVHGSTYAHPTELLSVIAFEKLSQISQKMKTLLDANRGLLRQFLSKRDDLDYFWPEYGTIVFPHLKRGSVDDLCSLLRADFDTTVVPGSFFESRDRFRLGIGMSTESVSESLAQLGRGLDAYKRKFSKAPAQ